MNGHTIGFRPQTQKLEFTTCLIIVSGSERVKEASTLENGPSKRSVYLRVRGIYLKEVFILERCLSQKIVIEKSLT